MFKVQKQTGSIPSLLNPKKLSHLLLTRFQFRKHFLASKPDTFVEIVTRLMRRELEI